MISYKEKEMMKHTYRFVALGAAVFSILFIVSCTPPQVYTDVLMTYPPSVEADSVSIFEPGDAVPADAMRLGSVAVVDNGLSHHCKYDQVLTLARKETAKAGGNAIRLVEHVTPSFHRGTCHQIWGDMLLLGKVDADSIDFISYARAALEKEEQHFHDVVERQMPTNRIRISGGGALDPDKLETTSNKSRMRYGWTAMVGYEHVIEEFASVGFNYTHVGGNFSRYGRYRMDFVGPSTGLGQRFKNNPKWLYDINFALGFAYYSIENFHSRGGLGGCLNGGVDYMLTRNIGLGIEAGFVVGAFKRPDEVIIDSENEQFALGTFHLLGGLRFYF